MTASRYDPRQWMWGEAMDVLARAEHLHRQLFRAGPAVGAGPRWEPPMDVLETDGEVVIIAALPGVREPEISFTNDGRALVIAGSRTLPAELRTAVIHRLELRQGRFERRVALPPGRYSQILHRAQDGCLIIRLRKQV